MPRQQLGVALADVADAERKDQTLQRDAAAGIDRGKQIAHRGFAVPLARLSLLVDRASRFCSVKMSAGDFTQPVLVKFLDLLVAEAVDIEGRRDDEMLEPLHRLRRTDQRAGAAARDPPRRRLSSRTAWLPQAGHFSGNL